MKRDIFYYIGWFARNIVFNLCGIILMILVFPFTFLRGYLHPFKFEFSPWPLDVTEGEYDMIDLGAHISFDIIVCFIFMLFCLYPIQSLIVTAILIVFLFLLMCSNKYCTIKKYEINENKDN